MLYEILTGQSAEFDNINELIPELPRFRTAFPILPDGGRLIKTHEAYRKDYQKAVYIVRDIRDIVLSQYARETELGMLDGLYKSFDDYLPPFMQGRTTGFGPWHRHVQSWLESPPAKKDNLLVVHFQDLRTNTEDLLVQIAEFLGARPDLKRIQDAIANNSLEKMRVKEDRAQKLHKSTGEEGRFVRKGAIQGWRQKLTEAQIQLIEQYAGTELARLGYPTGYVAARQDLGVPVLARGGGEL